MCVGLFKFLPRHIKVWFSFELFGALYMYISGWMWKTYSKFMRSNDEQPILNIRILDFVYEYEFVFLRKNLTKLQLIGVWSYDIVKILVNWSNNQLWTYESGFWSTLYFLKTGILKIIKIQVFRKYKVLQKPE